MLLRGEAAAVDMKNVKFFSFAGSQKDLLDAEGCIYCNTLVVNCKYKTHGYLGGVVCNTIN